MVTARPLALAAALVAAGCPAPPGPAPQPTPGTAPSAPLPTATDPPSPSPAPSASAPGAVGVTLFVGPAMVDCEGGAGPMRCLRVRRGAGGDWELFYQSIEGFTHEEGHSYELRVAVEPAGGQPADGSTLRYRLLEVVAKRAGEPELVP